MPRPRGGGCRRLLVGLLIGASLGLAGCQKDPVFTTIRPAMAPFAIGGKARTLQPTMVRAAPDPAANAVATAPPGAQGILESSKATAGAAAWWRVTFDEGFA
ncbi:MAG: hypothetical protein ACREH6_07190, partial [Geminicoccaceae bacterium]